MIRMNVHCWIFSVALGMACLTGTGLTAASEVTVGTVRGEVVATNLKDTPHTIVVRVILPNKKELIVGASVSPDTGITRGRQSVTLADIKVGEPVNLTFLKSPHGLITRSIHVR